MEGGIKINKIQTAGTILGFGIVAMLIANLFKANKGIITLSAAIGSILGFYVDSQIQK